MFPFLAYLTVLVVATCGLVYEFVAGALTGYLLGSGITQFSIVIGVFLFASGVGAYLSKFVTREVARRFIEIELGAALIGGLAAPLLFLSFSRPRAFLAAVYVVVLLLGTIVGLEIPLLMRLLRRYVQFRELVSRALAFDYLGALLAGVLFALVFLPTLGLVRTGLVFGLTNATVALSGTWLFASSLDSPRPLRWKAAAVIGALSAALVFSETLTRKTEALLYADPIVYAEQTRFQRVVLTSGRGGFHLFLDGNLQFSSIDEYRYHEALVHPAMTRATRRQKVLVLGGGDGLAVREILRYPDVESVTLVDIDPAMTHLAVHHPVFDRLNRGSLRDPRVRVVNEDAMGWLRDTPGAYDVAIVDFPDPNSYALGKLYTTAFYRLLLRRLSDGGVVAVQATSPLAAPKSFWCIVHTLEDCGLTTYPYHAAVPSFGEWGFVLVGRQPLQTTTALPSGLRFLTPDTIPLLFSLPHDMQPVPTEVNRLSSQVLVRYYDEEWRRLL